MKRVGLTGGIASGKSTVTGILRGKGYTVIDADAVNHRLMEPGQPIHKALVGAFGGTILVDPFNGESVIDRARLAAIVFNDEGKRRRLNDIAHPLIYDEILHQLDYYSTRLSNHDIIFIDIPLLFETWEKVEALNLDLTWLVYVDEKTQLERLRKRNDLSLEEAKSRIDSQMGIEEKVRLADVVIDNRGSLGDLNQQIDCALNQTNEWM